MSGLAQAYIPGSKPLETEVRSRVPKEGNGLVPQGPAGAMGAEDP